MQKLADPPRNFVDFTTHYPKLGEAWELTREAGAEGPLDDAACRLVKLGIAIGSMLEGPVHSATRKALAADLTPEQIHQVLALATGTIGFPSTVAAFSWVREVLNKHAAS